LQENPFMTYSFSKIIIHKNKIRSPVMPQFLRMSLVDGLAFNPNNNLGGAGAHYKFSKFKKLKLNQGLGVNKNIIIKN